MVFISSNNNIINNNINNNNNNNNNLSDDESNYKINMDDFSPEYFELESFNFSSGKKVEKSSS
ncbi:hypothetical protein [Methanobrevibacter arboriphilus]|uniref:hypothetical protein n=1 Tax=Methanobrevibacter arboriphilus TaxID=39441 RepID=UPI000AA25763|nr:hypothetical protein [Methanobrevibacter arboriphilus]